MALSTQYLMERAERWERPSPVRPLTEAARRRKARYDQIEALRRQGLLYEQIAARVGVSFSTVSAVLRGRGAPIPPRLRPVKQKDDTRMAEMRALRDQRWTMRAIAQKFNLSFERVRQLLNESGRKFEYACKVCGKVCQTRMSAGAEFCGVRCGEYLRNHGTVEAARAAMAAEDERKAKNAEGLYRCYGPCRRWLPDVEFVGGKPSNRFCRPCQRARTRARFAAGRPARQQRAQERGSARQARDAQVIALREQGKTFKQIAEVTGISDQRAWEICNSKRPAAAETGEGPGRCR